MHDYIKRATNADIEYSQIHGSHDDYYRDTSLPVVTAGQDIKYDQGNIMNVSGVSERLIPSDSALITTGAPGNGCGP
jgi:hypothetical protein